MSDTIDKIEKPVTEVVENRFEALEALRVPFEQYLAEISLVVVETAEQYTAAAEGLKALKKWQKDITDYFEPERLRTYNAYNAVTTTKSAYINKAEAVERVIKGKMGTFQLAEQKRIAEEQRKQREAEEAVQREIEAAMPTPEQPVIMSTVVVPEVSAPTKVSGVSVRKTWKYKITNLDAIKKEFWTLNEAMVLKVVRDLGKNAEGVVGGIAVEEDVIIGAGGR